MDQNTLLHDGVFVEFFGRLASTSVGLVRLALRTEAPVLLSLVIWDKRLKKYRLRFERLPLLRRADPEEEVIVNTAYLTQRIEEYVRRYPDQWLWVHRRWKTRPPGEPPLYPF